MGLLDKDIIQKEKAIRYCISNGVLPYLEVIVNNIREITEVNTVITDLDVLGVEISRRGVLKRTLFDCKTVNKMSPINRAFWAAGIMSYVQCDEAYVILRRKASEAHRVSAKSLNVHLFQEKDFDSYAESSSIDYLDKFTYSSSISNWVNYYSIFEKNASFKGLGEHLNVQVPIEQDYAKTLRGLIGIVRSVKGDLDPENKGHMSVYFSILMSFIFLMAPISAQLSDIYEDSMSLSKYEEILRYYIWGGRETYIRRRDLKNAIQVASGNVTGELELPGWENFVQVSRAFLDAPSALKDALIPSRELSLRYVSDIDKNIDHRLSMKIKKSNRTKQFILASSDYFCKSIKIPKDFHKNLVETFSLIEQA